MIDNKEEKSVQEKPKIVHFRYFFYPFLAFLFGIIVARRLYMGDIEIAIVTTLVVIATIVIFSLRKSFIPLAIMLGFFFVGNGFYYLGSLSFNVKDYRQDVVVVGRITDDIDQNGYGYTILLDDVVVNGENEHKINLYIQNCYQRPKPGTIITFEGRISKVKPFTLKSFNSSDYRSGARYSSSVKYSDLTMLDEGFCKLDEKVRVSVKNLLQTHMSKDSAAVAYAILFGDKNDVDPAITNTYKNSGIIHILTVSGLHVGFLVGLFYKLLNRFRVNRYVVPVLVAAFILFYAYLCGFTPSVLRAGIMAIILMLAKTFYRSYDPLNSLGIAGFIICMTKPLSALDIGFLMSFFCVFSLITVMPVISNFLKRFIPKKLADLIAVSLAAQLGILPFLAYFGSQVHLLAFVANLIIIPILSVLYPYLFVVSMLGTFMPFLGYLLVPADYIFQFIYMVARFFEWSHLTVPVSADFLGVFILLFACIFAASGYFMKPAFKKFALVAAASLVMTFALGLYQIPTLSKSNVAFISSGSNQAIVFTNSKREKLVVGYDYLLSRYQRNYMTGSFNAYLALDGNMSGYYAEKLHLLGCDKFVANKNIGDDKATLIDTNHFVGVGNFSVCYAEENGKIIGVFIILDQTCIFVANGKNMVYNSENCKSFETYKPNLVFAGNNAIEFENKNYTLVTLNREYGGDYNFNDDGNMLFKLGGGKISVRGLD